MLEDDFFEQDLLKSIDKILARHQSNEEGKEYKPRKSRRLSDFNSTGTIDTVGQIHTSKQQRTLRSKKSPKTIDKEINDALGSLSKDQYYKYNTLDAKEERELAKKAKVDRQAKEKFILSNLRLVLYVAIEYQGLGLDFEDLVQEGYIGLIKAVENYDPNLGNRFSTYAFWWITREIKHAISKYGSIIKVPIAVYEMVNHIKEAQKKFELEYSRSPTLKELSEYSGIDVKQILQVQNVPLKVYPLDIPINQLCSENAEEQLELIKYYGNDCCLEDLLVDAKNMKEEVASADRIEQIVEVLNTFPEHKREILFLLFGLKDGEVKTLEEVGKTFGIARERVRQIKNEAIARLNRHSFGSKSNIRKKKMKKEETPKETSRVCEDQDLKRILYMRSPSIGRKLSEKNPP